MTNEAEMERLAEFMHTECTYGDEYEDKEKHPHIECWCCKACLAKKLSALESSNKELEEKLRVAKEAIEIAQFYIVDPDDMLEVSTMTLEYRRPLTQEERLQKEIERVRKMKSDKKIVSEALKSL